MKMAYMVYYKWSTEKKLFIEKNRFFSVDSAKINELHVVNT